MDGRIGDTGAGKYWYVTDHVGSIRAVTDKDGKKVWSADYLAFGKQYIKDGDFEELHSFTGKEYDPDTGLHYYNARWYDADLGRFISEDPVGANLLYGYSSNNPINRIDPTGCIDYSSEINWDDDLDGYRESNYLPGDPSPSVPDMGGSEGSEGPTVEQAKPGPTIPEGPNGITNQGDKKIDTKYFRDGNIKSQTTYNEDGTKNNTTYFNHDGSIQSQVNYKDDKIFTQVSYYKDGSIRSFTSHNEEGFIQVHANYNKDGTIESIVTGVLNDNKFTKEEQKVFEELKSKIQEKQKEFKENFSDPKKAAEALRDWLGQELLSQSMEIVGAAIATQLGLETIKYATKAVHTPLAGVGKGFQVVGYASASIPTPVSIGISVVVQFAMDMAFPEPCY